MQETWLKKEGQQDCVIFVLGWAATPNAIAHINIPNADVLCCYEHREISLLKADDFSNYRRITLFAWSFGVWVSEQICAHLPLYKAIAFNGTPFPVDDRYGMRLRVVMRTAQGIAKVGIKPFQEKTYGALRYIPEGPFEETSLDEKVLELTSLAEASKEATESRIAWTQAYIGDKDEIFLPLKMWAYWETRGLGIGFDSYHYPFSDPQLILSLID